MYRWRNQGLWGGRLGAAASAACCEPGIHFTPVELLYLVDFIRFSRIRPALFFPMIGPGTYR